MWESLFSKSRACWKANQDVENILAILGYKTIKMKNGVRTKIFPINEKSILTRTLGDGILRHQ